MGRRPFVRDQILEAAFDCFARRGFEAVSSRDVAKAAGVGPASMYRHFDSMEALGRAVYELALAPIIQEFHSISETKPDPPTALTEALHLLYRNYDERPRALALLVFPPHDFTPWELDSENGRNPRCRLNAMLAADEDLCALCWGALIGPLQDRLLSRRVGPMSPLADAHAALVVRLLEEKP